MPFDQEDLHFRLPWEATAIILTFVFGLPLAVGAFAFFLHPHGDIERFFGYVCGGLALPFLIWASFAIRSRIKKGRAAGELSKAFIKPIMLSFGGLTAAILIWLFLEFVVRLPVTAHIVPAGLFIASLALFGRAMSPPQPLRPPSSPRRKAPRY